MFGLGGELLLCKACTSNAASAAACIAVPALTLPHDHLHDAVISCVTPSLGFLLLGLQDSPHSLLKALVLCLSNVAAGGAKLAEALMRVRGGRN
jgi:hypothetical protein